MIGAFGAGCIGMDVKAAHECTDVLVASDLRGNDSHGVSNMLRNYVSYW